MATPKVYVICDQNCKFESMTKEQILAAIMQAVNEGTIGDVDAGFITTIKTINDLPVRFFYGDQAAYNALSEEEKIGVYALITNDTTISGINEAIKELQDKVKSIEDGETPILKARGLELDFIIVNKPSIPLSSIERGLYAFVVYESGLPYSERAVCMLYKHDNSSVTHSTQSSGSPCFRVGNSQLDVNNIIAEKIYSNGTVETSKIYGYYKIC